MWLLGLCFTDFFIRGGCVQVCARVNGCEIFTGDMKNQIQIERGKRRRRKEKKEEEEEK